MNLKLKYVLIILSLTSLVKAFFSFEASAQTAGSVDLSFDSGSCLNGTIYASVQQTDGKWIVGGAFTAVHGAAIGRVARLYSDGTTDLSFMNGLIGANNTVYATAVQTNGEIIVGGAFTNINGIARRGIARLNINGALDTNFLNGMLGFNGTVNTILIQSDGKILAGGSFSTANGVAYRGIARLNLDGSLDASFVNGLGGMDSLAVVSTIVLDSTGRIMIGGSFKESDGVEKCIARLNANGSMDSTFKGYVDSSVYAIAPLKNGQLFIGGDFVEVGSQSFPKLARINSDGSLDSSFHVVNMDGDVYAIALQSDSNIVIGGTFSLLTDESTFTFNQNGVARISYNGDVDYTFAEGLPGASSMVYSVNLNSNNEALVGGGFISLCGVQRISLAQLKTNGDVKTNFNNIVTGANRDIYSIALDANGKVVAGGIFTTVNTNTVGRLARYNGNGSLDTNFSNGNIGANSGIDAVAIEGDGKILAVGQFTKFNGVTRNHIVRVNTNGTVDTNFLNNLAGANYEVTAVVIQNNAKIIIGGNFTSVNGSNRSRIARLNSDGSLDVSFQNGMPGANTTITCLAVQPDGKILVGGYFTNFNGFAVNGITRLNTDGSIDSLFPATLTGGANSVFCIALDADLKILIGGYFTSVSGVARNGIARLNQDGTVDASFQSGLLGVNWTVYCLCPQIGRKILIGGSFTSVNGVAINRLVRLNADGSIDLPFQNNESGTENDVRTIVTQPDGNLIVGGLFSTISGIAKSRVARLFSGILPPELVASQISSNESFGFSLLGQAGHSYTIQNSKNLADWIDVTNLTLANTNLYWQESGLAFGQKNFYRLKTQ